MQNNINLDEIDDFLESFEVRTKTDHTNDSHRKRILRTLTNFIFEEIWKNKYIFEPDVLPSSALNYEQLIYNSLEHFSNLDENPTERFLYANIEINEVINNLKSSGHSAKNNDFNPLIILMLKAFVILNSDIMDKNFNNDELYYYVRLFETYFT